MTLFLIRDDDANATTDPARLERAYAPLLDAGCPLTFSVIPSVGLDTLAPDGRPERFLPPDLAGPPVDVVLRAGSPLAVWLRADRAQRGVAQHGLDHRRVRGRTEFGALERREAYARMLVGRDLLTEALGAAPLGFVAPWDALSRGSLQAAVELFPVVSTSWLDRDRLPVHWWPAHAAERLQRSERLRLGGSMVLRHRGGPIGPETAPADVPAILDQLAHRAEVAVIMLHHWMFWETPEPHPVVRALARALASRRTVGLRELAAQVSRPGAAPVSLREAVGGVS
jgi:hypothetical protein